jgi:adenylate cyclase
MVERLPAADVVPLLDEFFRVLAVAANQFGGEVYHMAGDGIMAGFGVNAEIGGGAAEALAAGHAMLDGFAPVARRWRTDLSVDAGIGIGLHLGEVAFGVLGPPGRKTTTLVGDTVNVAARLCSRARAGEVLFSCTVAAALSISAADTSAGSTSFLQLPQFELRGRRGPIDIWCVPAPERLAL